MDIECPNIYIYIYIYISKWVRLIDWMKYGSVVMGRDETKRSETNETN